MVRNPCIAGALYFLAALSPSYLVATSSAAATRAKSKNSTPRAQHEAVRTDLTPRSKTDCFAVAKTLNERAKTTSKWRLSCLDVSRLPPSQPIIHMASSRPSRFGLFRHARPCSYRTGHAARPVNLCGNGRVCQTCFYPLCTIGAGRGKPPRARAPEVGQTTTDRKRDCRERKRG
jgi:hypothetical protein